MYKSEVVPGGDGFATPLGVIITWRVEPAVCQKYHMVDWDMIWCASVRFLVMMKRLAVLVEIDG